MSKTIQAQVIEFHRAFGHPIASSPTIPPDERVRFRARLILEEALEFVEACFDSSEIRMGYNGVRALDDARDAIKAILDKATVKVDLAEAVDALADIDYVVEGTRLEFGVNGPPIAAEVHRSNMAKKGGERRPDGKTLKPAGWTKPDIAGELRAQTEDPLDNGLEGVLAEGPTKEWVAGEG